MIAEVSFPGSKKISTEIILPASKSISNRVLIIRALAKMHAPVHNLSEANDTTSLVECLANGGNEIDAGDGGTTLRFLLAYLCVSEREVVLTASVAMRKRPVENLVNALRQLGANIEYTENSGQLPVKINPGKLKGGYLEIDGDISSQFISALMLIGPYLSGGLTIKITGEILSVPYIQMTMSVMKYFGGEVNFETDTIQIREGKYAENEFTIEPDWSAASYWYEIAALTPGAEIILSGLKRESIQGDSGISEMMKNFGVETDFNERGAFIQNKKTITPEYFTDNFTGCPDLGPAMAATCAALNVTADLQGLKNFRLKESDRAAALQRELYNMNVKTDFCAGSKFKIYSGAGLKSYHKAVNTYNDHRIAMSFAPLAIKTGKILIDDCMVVTKSYPRFYEDLQKAGFTVTFKD